MNRLELRAYRRVWSLGQKAFEGRSDHVKDLKSKIEGIFVCYISFINKLDFRKYV